MGEINGVLVSLAWDAVATEGDRVGACYLDEFGEAWRHDPSAVEWAGEAWEAFKPRLLAAFPALSPEDLCALDVNVFRPQIARVR